MEGGEGRGDSIYQGSRMAQWQNACPRAGKSVVPVSATASCCGGELQLLLLILTMLVGSKCTAETTNSYEICRKCQVPRIPRLRNPISLVALVAPRVLPTKRLLPTNYYCLILPSRKLLGLHISTPEISDGTCTMLPSICT